MNRMILVMVLPERLVLLDTIVLLTVPAANVRLVQKTKLKIPVPVLLVRQQKAAPTAAQATQLPQAAAHPYALCVKLLPVLLQLAIVGKKLVQRLLQTYLKEHSLVDIAMEKIGIAGHRIFKIICLISKTAIWTLSIKLDK